MKGTIHIFGYGEAQLISDTVNFKASIDKFTKLQSVIDDIKSKKPKDKVAGDYHAINIFGDLRADYIAKSVEGLKSNSSTENISYSIPFKDLDSKKIEALIAEFVSLLGKSTS